MRAFPKFAVALMVSWLFWSGHASAAEPPAIGVADQVPALDALIKKQMRDAGMVGLGAAIIVDRKVVWMKGYGLADRERGVPFTPQTVMNIGSISKTFTGVALMQAVQQGKLSLDEDINRYLPFKVVNPYFPGQSITLRQLGNHTSGITDRWSVYQHIYHYGGERPEPLGTFLQQYFAPEGATYAKENFLDVRPGTHREYSNIGAALAGYIVERAVGKTLDEYARGSIFAPLNMQNTSWTLSGVAPGKHAALYVSQDGLSVPISLYEETTYPDGGVRTSVEDLSKLFIALLDGGAYQGASILDKPIAAQMLRFSYNASNAPDNIILAEKNAGIFWETKYNVTKMGHGGSDPGVKTEMLSDLSGQVGVIVFTNTSLGNEDMGKYEAVSKALWDYAERLRRSVH